MNQRVLALVPAHNEGRNLVRVVEELTGEAPWLDILVIDDGSDDETRELLPNLPVRWLRFPERLGIGSAMRAGMKYAQRQGYETVVRIDGDGQHRPAQIPDLLELIRRGEVDAVVGSRYVGGVGYRATGTRRLTQLFLATCLSSLLRRPVTDPTSGFWAFGAKAIRYLSVFHPTDYPEPELLMLLGRNGFRVAEVPVSMRERHSGRSTLTLPRATIAFARALLAMLVIPFRPPHEFIP